MTITSFHVWGKDLKRVAHLLYLFLSLFCTKIFIIVCSVQLHIYCIAY